jgi:hypothetical protein
MVGNAPMIRRMNGVYLKGAEESKKAYYNKEWSSSDRASAQASFTQSSSDKWLGNHSLKATYYVNQLLSSFYTCIKISMTLEAWIHACTTASTL